MFRGFLKKAVMPAQSIRQAPARCSQFTGYRNVNDEARNPNDETIPNDEARMPIRRARANTIDSDTQELFERLSHQRGIGLDAGPEPEGNHRLVHQHPQSI
jgi:hypothetical protein